MANNYTMLTAKTTVTATREQFDTVNRLMEGSGVTVEFYENEKASQDWGMIVGELYFYAEDGYLDEAFTNSEFLNVMQEILLNNKMEYLEFGYAFTCDKMRPGEFGGGEFRIYDNATLVYPMLVWER